MGCVVPKCGSADVEQLLDWRIPAIHDGERAALRAGKLTFGVDAERVVDGRHAFRGCDRPLRGIAADLIALANDAAAFHAAAGKADRPHLGPVIPATGRIHLWRAAELG